MGTLKSRWVYGAALLSLCCGAVMGWRVRTAPLPPLEVGLWYWHQPFRLRPAEVVQLKRLEIRQLFVRAGTFRREGKGVRLTLPQQWQSRAGGIRVQLVFNFGYDVVRAFRHLETEKIAHAVILAAGQARGQAEAAGLAVDGVQLDFDCPTSLLPLYTQLLHQLQYLREPKRATLSITALPTWFSSRKVGPLLAAVDFAAPQYYEANTPAQRGDFTPISNLHHLERGLRAAASCGTPFYAGLPAYGHALVYDAGGRLLGTYHDQSLRAAAHQPGLRLLRTYPADAQGHPASPQTYSGEDVGEFVTTAALPHGSGQGYHLLYDLPTPVLLARHLALLREQRPANCRGAILFRYPEPGESQTLSLNAIGAALHNETAQPKLRVTLAQASAPWELIESPQRGQRTPMELTLAVTNIGTAHTFPAPGAVSMTLCMAGAGLDAIAPGGFDSVQTFLASGLNPGATPSQIGLRASVQRANVVQASLFELLAGETVRLGPLRLRPGATAKVWGAWSVRGVGGFARLSGKIPVTKLSTVGDKP